MKTIKFTVPALKPPNVFAKLAERRKTAGPIESRKGKRSEDRRDLLQRLREAGL